MRPLIVIFLAGVCCSGAKAEMLTGVVFQKNGGRAAGATVNVSVVHHSPPLRWVIEADDDGRFQLDLPTLEGSERFALAARWKSQGAQVFPKLAEIDNVDKFREVTSQAIAIRLKECGRLRGRLLSENDDKPLKKASVYMDTGELLVTDEKGEFSINGLPLGEHSLIPVAQGHVRQYINFDTTNRQDAELELRLARGTSVTGNVTDEDGKAIPGAYLTRLSSGTSLTLNGWDQACQPDGRFKYDGISLTRLFHGFEACAPGYLSRQVPYGLEKRLAAAEVNVRLKRKPILKVAELKSDDKANLKEESPANLPRRTVLGFVRDSNGKPVSGAEVRWGASSWDRSVPSETTDVRGRFMLKQVPEGQGALLIIADGFAPQFKALGQNNRRLGPSLDVVLDRGTEVCGIIRTPDGTPVSGVQVVPVTCRPDTGFMNNIWIDERSATTNKKGEFEISALSDGFRFDILKAGYSEQRNATLEFGGIVNNIELESGGAVSGTVVDENEEPVRNFNIRLRIPREYDQDEMVGGYYAGFGWYGVSFTRKDGTFVVSDLNEHSLMRLIASSPGVGFAILDRSKADSIDQLPSFEQTVMRLEQFKPLSVQVVDAKTKKPLSNGVVMLLEDEPDLSRKFQWGYDELKAKRVRTGEAGLAVFNEPACVDGTLAVLVSGYARKHVAWIDESPTVTIELEVTSTLSGTVNFRDRPVTVGVVYLVDEDNRYFVDLADSDGSFTFDQIPAGDYELMVSDSNGQSNHSQQITIKPSEQKTILIKIPETSGFDVF